MTVPWLSTDAVALAATAEAAELASAMAAAHLRTPGAPAAEMLTQQALQPAHDAQPRAGVSVRVWRSKCYALGASPGWLVSMLKALCWWCHSPLAWPAGADSPGAWLRSALGTRR